MASAVLTRGAVREISVPEVLACGFRGDIVVPADDRYEVARRVWNAEIDRRPAAILRCKSAADVVAAVRFARTTDLPVAVRSGGHSVAGLSVCDGGIVVDLAAMKGIRVDTARRTVRAQAGVVWGELDRETQLFGLATPGGVVSHTGIAGLSLGGGIGWLMRKYGATIDNIRSIDIVTADAGVLTASDEENAELFWGLRGSGWNFGVATSFEYQLHPVGPVVLAGAMFFRMEDAVQVLRRYRDWIADAPDELTTIVTLRVAPPFATFPESVHGVPTIYVTACFSGDIEAGERCLRPLADFARPIGSTLAPKPFLQHQQFVDPSSPWGWHYYWRSCELPPLTDDIIEILVEHGRRTPGPLCKTNIYHLGGQMSRIPDGATAFYSDRKPSHNASFNAVWTEDHGDPEPLKEWARTFADALGPFHRERTYVNFLTDQAENPIRAAYGPEKYDQLVLLKRKFDPTNFFRLNANVVP